MSNIVEAPPPRELLNDLREEARSLPKNPEDKMLKITRNSLARWMRSLHSKKELGGTWGISKEEYDFGNNRFAINYSFNRLDTVAIVGPKH